MAANKRITPEMVLEAYKEQGLVPLCGDWLYIEEGKCYACALSAVVVHKCGSTMYIERALRDEDMDAVRFLICDELELPSEYVNGFALGFDSLTLNKEDAALLLPSEKYAVTRLGLKDGIAARKEVEKFYALSHIDILLDVE